MSIDRDVNKVAGVGRCPFAQVLRNSLSGHPPTTGHKTILKRIPLRKRQESELRTRIAKHLSRRIRTHGATLLKWATNYSEAEELDYLFQIFAVEIVEGI